MRPHQVDARPGASAAIGKKKDEFIEIWRGVAIAVVVYFHYVQRLPAEAYGLTRGPVLPFYSGNVGVLVFFVISGFLISKSLEFSSSLSDFYAKRLSRIWPLFLLASVFTFAVIQLTAAPILFEGAKPMIRKAPGIVDLIGTVLFLGDFNIQWVDGVFWSILVELKFYAIIGALAALSPRHYPRIFATLAFIVSFAQIGLTVLVPELAFWPVKLMNGLLVAQYLPFFAAGVLLYKRDTSPLFSLNAIMLFVNLIDDSGRFPGFNLHDTIAFIFAFSGLMALDAVLLQNRIFRFLGKYSYALYLFHQINGIIIISLLTPQLGIEQAALIAFACTLLLSVLASWIAEWRFRRTTHRLLARMFGWIGLQKLSVSERVGEAQ